MTNQDILKRLAEIEGIKIACITKSPKSSVVFRKSTKYGDFDVAWSPLDLWRDCGPLMVKHFKDMQLSHDDSCVYINANLFTPDLGDSEVRTTQDRDYDIRKAICLAVIAKHEGR